MRYMNCSSSLLPLLRPCGGIFFFFSWHMLWFLLYWRSSSHKLRIPFLGIVPYSVSLIPSDIYHVFNLAWSQPQHTHRIWQFFTDWGVQNFLFFHFLSVAFWGSPHFVSVLILFILSMLHPKPTLLLKQLENEVPVLLLAPASSQVTSLSSTKARNPLMKKHCSFSLKAI